MSGQLWFNKKSSRDEKSTLVFILVQAVCLMIVGILVEPIGTISVKSAAATEVITTSGDLRSETDFTKYIWALNWNLVKILYPVNMIWNHPARSQIRTCNDSLAVMICAKLWPDWVINFRVRAAKKMSINYKSMNYICMRSTGQHHLKCCQSSEWSKHSSIKSRR